MLLNSSCCLIGNRNNPNKGVGLLLVMLNFGMLHKGDNFQFGSASDIVS